MATIDSKTNVYEITRSTPGSTSNLEQLIRSIVKEVLLEVINTEEFRGPKGNDGNDGADGINGNDGANGNDGLDGNNLDVGCTNVVCYDNSGEDNSWYTLIAGVKAEWNDNIAAAQTKWEAYVDKNESWAVLRNLIYAKHDENTASINSQMAAYTNDVESLAYHTDLLQATYNGVAARIEEDSKVWAGDISSNIISYTKDPCSNGTPIDTSRELVIGDIAKYATYHRWLNDSTKEFHKDVNGNVIDIPGSCTLTANGYTCVEFDIRYKQYVGTNTINNGCPWITTAAAGTTAFGTAKSLYTDPITGNITGWEYVDGSGSDSTFAISADNFYISNSSTKKKPFEIKDDNINFNGKVSIGNIDGLSSLASRTQPYMLLPYNTYYYTHNLYGTTKVFYNIIASDYVGFADPDGDGAANKLSVKEFITTIALPKDNYVAGDTIPYTLYGQRGEGSTHEYYEIISREMICFRNHSADDLTEANLTSYWNLNNVLKINGDMIVDGTLSANSITTGTLSVDVLPGLSTILEKIDGDCYAVKADYTNTLYYQGKEGDLFTYRSKVVGITKSGTYFGLLSATAYGTASTSSAEKIYVQIWKNNLYVGDIVNMSSSGNIPATSGNYLMKVNKSDKITYMIKVFSEGASDYDDRRYYISISSMIVQ